MIIISIVIEILIDFLATSVAVLVYMLDSITSFFAYDLFF